MLESIIKFSKLFEVKVGKVQVLKDWLVTLGAVRKKEALATFAYENITREVFVLFKGDDRKCYVAAFNEMSGIHRKEDPTVQINKEHKRIREECLEPISSPGEVLLDLQS